MLFAGVLGLSACASSGSVSAPRVAGLSAAEARGLETMLRGESRVSGDALARPVAAADARPLGSKENPVRASRPEGQRAYLARLRCGDGRAPKYSRNGSYGVGVFGNIIDGYAVDCGSAAPGRTEVFMDMYHPSHVETRAAPGFTIMASGGTGNAPIPVA